jgi:hypothetical protein
MSIAPPRWPEQHLASDLPIRTVRYQMAVVRTLVDDLERVTATRAPPLDGQLVEALATLACRVIEAAAELAAVVDGAAEESGVHARVDLAWLQAGRKKATPGQPASLSAEET